MVFNEASFGSYEIIKADEVGTNINKSNEFINL